MGKAALNRLKCRWCGWSTPRWHSNRRGQHLHGFLWLRDHVAFWHREHMAELPAQQEQADALDSYFEEVMEHQP
jgi:hypothetical protein